MKTKRFLSVWMILVITSTLFLGACAPAAPAKETSDTVPTSIILQSDPAEVVQAFWNAVNSQDIEAALSMVADDIKCRGTLYVTGKDLFRVYLESTYKGTGKTYKISNVVASGDTVTYDWQAYTGDTLQASGTNESMIIQDGIIIQFNGT